jgi:hypothetical protein
MTRRLILELNVPPYVSRASVVDDLVTRHNLSGVSGREWWVPMIVADVPDPEAVKADPIVKISYPDDIEASIPEMPQQ